MPTTSTTTMTVVTMALMITAIGVTVMAMFTVDFSHDSKLYLQIWEMKAVAMAVLKFDISVDIRTGFSGLLRVSYWL